MKRELAAFFPWLLSVKAICVAVRDRLTPMRSSYSQGGEDAEIMRLCGGNPPAGPYVDVGANHPTRLSNTYLFYRLGKRGIVIEPASHLLRLYRRIRPGDVTLAIACGAESGVLEFVHAAADVLSGIATSARMPSRVKRVEWVPVLMLDDVLDSLAPGGIFLLSIDVEGFDHEVVQGATRTLARTRFVIVEGVSTDERLCSFFDSRGYSLKAKTVHNLIFENDSLVT